MIVEAGTSQDLDEIMVIMHAAFDPQFGEAWSAAQCLSVLGMPGSKLFLARSNGPCGFILVRTILDECEIMLLGVMPAARRRGLATRLLEHAISDACYISVKTVHLEVRADNPAIDLYRARGFEMVRTRPGYYRTPHGTMLDAKTYRRILS